MHTCVNLSYLTFYFFFPSCVLCSTQHLKKSYILPLGNSLSSNTVFFLGAIIAVYIVETVWCFKYK